MKLGRFFLHLLSLPPPPSLAILGTGRTWIHVILYHFALLGGGGCRWISSDKGYDRKEGNTFMKEVPSYLYEK
jgi:hypothetical protein